MKYIIDCAAQLKSLILPIELLGKKSPVVVSMEQLMENLKMVKKPAVGILYEGARAADTPSGAGRQIGVSTNIGFTLILVTEVSVISSIPDFQPQVHELLDELREAIQGVRSPSGHMWKWVMEGPAKTKNDTTVWLQRWSTPAQLAPKNKIG